MENELKLLKALFWGRKQKLIFDKVSERHISDPHLCYVFKKARELFKKHDAVDVYSTFEHIRQNGQEFYDKLSEGKVFEHLTEKLPREQFNVDIIVAQLIEKRASTDALKKLEELKISIESYGISGIKDSVNELGRLVPTKTSVVKTGVQFEDEMLNLIKNNELPGIPTHYKGINKLLCGFEKGGYKTGVYCLGAYTKAGKSCFTRNVTIGQGQRHLARVTYYNFELDKNEQNARNIALVTSLRITDIINPVKSDETICEIKRGIKILKELYEERWFMTNNAPPSTIDELRDDIRMRVESFGMKIFVVDTFNKVSNPGDNSYKGYKDNAQEFERIAKELDITVILICQLFVDSKVWYKKDGGGMGCKQVDPRTVKPNCQDSNDTKELHKTCSSFLVLWWNSENSSIVHIAEDAARYGSRGLVSMKFDSDRESYEEISKVETWN